MLNETAMKNRIGRAVNQKVPIVNYGMAIAEMTGILKRAVSVFDTDWYGILYFWYSYFIPIIYAIGHRFLISHCTVAKYYKFKPVLNYNI